MIGKEEKLISIVIPVYNVQDYLSQTIECIIEQSYRNWELILVDDGSTDGSLEIERDYSLKDNRIIVYKRDRLPNGAPTCRNIGFEKAQGDYLIFFDSDDIIAPYCFRQRIDYMESNDCDFAVFPMMGFYKRFFDADGMVFGYESQNDYTSQFLARILPFVVVTNIYKRKSLLEKGIVWDTNLKSFQDSDFNLQTLRAGLSFKLSGALPDYFYRQSAQNSICKKLVTVSNCESQILFFKKQYKIYGAEKKYKGSLDMCAAQIYRNIIETADNKDLVREFKNLEVFNGRAVLRLNLGLVANLCSMFRSEIIENLLQILFIPVFFLRFKLGFKKYDKLRKKLYTELGEIYFERIDTTTRKRIEEKIQ